MKRIKIEKTDKRLVLTQSQIRKLESTDLSQVAGGAPCRPGASLGLSVGC